jgi:hypothetical protein
MSHRGKECHGKKLRRSSGKTDLDGEAGCQITHMKWKHLSKKKKKKIFIIIIISLPHLRPNGLLCSHVSICRFAPKSSYIWSVMDNL